MAAMSIHSVKTAPEASRAVLDQVQASIGAIPNLAGGMAEAPTLVRGFFTLLQIYNEGSLTAQEIQILSLANARENGCNWCVAFHSRAAIASGVDREEIEDILGGPAKPEIPNPLEKAPSLPPTDVNLYQALGASEPCG